MIINNYDNNKQISDDSYNYGLIIIFMIRS